MRSRSRDPVEDMPGPGDSNRIAATSELHSAHAEVTAAQRRLLEAIVDCDRQDTWRADGAQNLAQWLSAQLGISNWAAHRWINAAHTLSHLPLISAAFESGTLGLDKVVELCRFATPETEAKLITWARRVSVTGIRHRADVAASLDRDDVIEADRTRYLRYWWFDDGKRLGLDGSLAADQGAVVANALDRLAARIPEVIDDDFEPGSYGESLDARRADALVALASSQIANDPDAERATVVVHADLEALANDSSSCELAGGPAIDSETARRLACDGRLQTVLHDHRGHAVGIGRTARTVSAWLKRQLLYRDRCCLFPGCESRRFLHAHHLRHWIHGGPTDLDNLGLVCTWHHKLLHEYGWSMKLGPPGTATWFRPGDRPYDPGPRRLPERAPPSAQLAAMV